jgi:uncharacterized protein YjbJ (UPF0337 family)
METSGRDMETGGRPKEASGRGKEASGRRVEASGRRMETSGRRMETSGRAKEASGTAKEASGTAKEAGGKMQASLSMRDLRVTAGGLGQNVSGESSRMADSAYGLRQPSAALGKPRSGGLGGWGDPLRA